MSCLCGYQFGKSERQGIDIDDCPQCRGVWLDCGELDRLIERTLAALPTRTPPRQAPAAASPAQPGYYPEPRRDYPDGQPYRRQKKRGFLGDRFDFD